MDINTLHKNAAKGIKEAEKELFELLVVRFRYLATLRLRNKEDAEEVVQEAMIVISKEYKTITIKTSFSAWAHKVLQSQILNYVRSRSRKEKRFKSEANPDDIFRKDSMDSAPNLRRKLLDCLRKICAVNSRYARILNLHYQGYTTEEICEKMDITAANFYVILSRARSLLQMCLNTGRIE